MTEDYPIVNTNDCYATSFAIAVSTFIRLDSKQDATVAKDYFSTTF